MSLLLVVLVVDLCASCWFVDPASLEEGLDWDALLFCLSLPLSFFFPSSTSLLLLACLLACLVPFPFPFHFSSPLLCFPFSSLSNNLIFPTNSVAFPCHQWNRWAVKKLILTFVVVSFGFGVPVLVRFFWRNGEFLCFSACVRLNFLACRSTALCQLILNVLWTYFFISVLDSDLFFGKKKQQQQKYLILKKNSWDNDSQNTQQVDRMFEKYLACWKDQIKWKRSLWGAILTFGLWK